MQSPEIIAYLKTYCGWSAGVRAVLDKYNLAYTEKAATDVPTNAPCPTEQHEGAVKLNF